MWLRAHIKNFSSQQLNLVFHLITLKPTGKLEFEILDYKN